ncbi:unnamed protein product [Urochloa humidicola]
MEAVPTPAGAGGAASSSSSSSTPSLSTKRPTTTLRLLCLSSRAAALRPSRDLHVDHPPVGDEAVLVISGPDAPTAAVRAWERVVGHRVSGDEAMRGGGREGGDGRRRLPDAGRRRAGGVRAGEGREDGGADAAGERSPDQGVPE